MTETIEAVPDRIDQQQLAQQLVEAARAEGVELVGPGGLLTGLTKTVLETALEAEMTEHLGYDRHDPAGRDSGNSRNGTRKEFAAHLHACGVEFSVGASFAHLDVHLALGHLLAAAWTPAYQARRPRAAQTGVQIEPRDGAWVAEATGLTPLPGWPPGTRLILRKERPHPGAQLRTTDADGMPDHRVPHQHHPWRARPPTRRPRAAPPPPRPR